MSNARRSNCLLEPERASNIAHFFVRVVIGRSLSFGRFYKYLVTNATSQVWEYFGWGGRMLNAPFMNLHTSRCCPTGLASTGGMVELLADL